MVPPMTNLSKLTACPDCDLLISEETLSAGEKARCPRCGTVIRIFINNSIDKTIALAVTGLLLYIPAMLMPLMTFEIMDMRGSGNVIDSVVVLFENKHSFVAIMVLLTSVFFPVFKLFLLFIVGFCLKHRYYPKSLPALFRAYQHLAEWGMVEVYMLGILITIIKMHSMAAIEYNVGFFCFTALVFITAGSSVMLDEHEFWQKIEKNTRPTGTQKTVAIEAAFPQTAKMANLIRCHDCGKLVYNKQLPANSIARCPRCMAELHMRKPASISRTWALVLSSVIFFLPANILPIMRVYFLGTPGDSTILDGIIYFFHSGEFGIGLVIFTASILVPLFKVVGIILILLSIHFHWNGWLKHKTKMFHFIEFIGRWSFLDIFVIALLAAMVRFESLTTTEAALAAPYFTAVVLTTMFAALAFDPRILWDTCAENKEKLRKADDHTNH